MATDPLIPANSPFNYNVGINYDSWNPGTSVSADLNEITQNFKLIKTYHDAAVGTATPTTPIIDPSQQNVISYVTNSAHPNLQLVMGTNNNALAQGGFGTAWSAGLMAAPPVSPATTNPYTDSWVQMIINAFGSVSAVKDHLAMILLGNELDANGPPPSDATDFANYQTWINQSFANLSLSLANAGLGSIPISTTIANYPSVASANPIAVGTTTYILNNWDAAWNSGSPIVFFNQYTSAGALPATPPSPPGFNEAESTSYASVIQYFQTVQGQITAIHANAEAFVGETGYSTFWNAAQFAPTATPPGSAGPGSQANVYNQIFAWLGTEYAAGHKTIPLFAFQAFDVPSGDPVQAQYGIYDPGSGLKAGIVLPPWTSQPPTTQFGTTGNDKLVGSAASDSFYGGNGNDSIDGGSGQNTSIQAGAATSYAIKAAAGAATLTVQDKTGTDGTDQLANIQNIQFNDTTIVASWITKAASLPADQILKVVDLYTAGLNRAPDALGLDYWGGRLADGASINDIAKIFFSSPEAAPIYSSANSTPVFVNLTYSNALGRAPDPAGAAYWINELNTGHIQRTDLVTSLIAGARASGGSAADAAYIANKEAVGAHFALTQGLNNVTWARTVEAAVNGTAASVTGANAQTDAFAATAATAAGTELVVQIVGVVP
jgi:hypothetical protein